MDSSTTVSPSALLTLALVLALGVGRAATQESGPETDDSADSSKGRVVVDYRGTLQDGDGKPISGVFHLEFNLYDSPDADEPKWTERQYIGIVDGSYEIPLGRTEQLSRSEITSDRWIGIELVGGSEILRDKLQIRESQIAAKSGTPGTGPEVDTSETKQMIEKARNSDKMAFADVAQRAFQADKAKVAGTAEKIGSMSAEKIKELSNLALERLGEHVADPNAHQASGGGLGDERRVLDSVGGPGGSSYEKTCPPGWVVVGISGGEGRVVDSLALICKPIK